MLIPRCLSINLAIAIKYTGCDVELFDLIIDRHSCSQFVQHSALVSFEKSIINMSLIISRKSEEFDLRLLYKISSFFPSIEFFNKKFDRYCSQLWIVLNNARNKIP